MSTTRKRKLSNLSPISLSTNPSNPSRSFSPHNTISNLSSVCGKAWDYLKNSVDEHLSFIEPEDQFRKLSKDHRSPKRIKRTSGYFEPPVGGTGRTRPVSSLSKSIMSKINKQNKEYKPVFNISGKLDFDFAKYAASSGKSILKTFEKKSEHKPKFDTQLVFKKRFNRRRSRSVWGDSRDTTQDISREHSRIVGSSGLANSTSLGTVLANHSFANSSFVAPAPLTVSNNTPDLEIVKVRKIKPVEKKWAKTSGNYNPELDQLLASEKYRTYYRILESKRKLQETLFKQREESQKPAVKQLTKSQIEEVQQIWRLENKQPMKEITVIANIDIRVKDLCTLKDRRWINDNIIDAYLSLVVERNRKKHELPNIFAFTTHFFSTLQSKGYSGVKKWAKRKKIDVSKLDYIFVPINIMNSHWLFAVVDNKHKQFVYYDSLPGSGDSILPYLKEYMVQEFKKNHPGESSDYEDYSMVLRTKCPQQSNGFDCGIFVCTGINYLGSSRSLEYSQNDMEGFRRRMVYEIVNGELID